MKLIYNVKDKPPIGKTIVFALQQMMAIMAATIVVPMVMSVNAPLDGQPALSFDMAAALLGAGAGTIVYLLFTKHESPVFLGSSFTFLPAYAAVIGAGYGYLGVLIGITFAGLVYAAIAIIIKIVGSGWVNKLMPPIIVGPIVALIGLSLSGTATSWSMSNGGSEYNLISLLVALVSFFIIVIVSVKGGKSLKLIPFIIGIGGGYALALIFTLIGIATNVEYLQILSFQPFVEVFGEFSITSIIDFPKFTFIKAIETSGDYIINAAAIGNIALIFVPIGIVELAQHIGDHKNLSNIINKDLITTPGLDRTLLGDGIGSIVGGIFGGAANTTYGESIGCVAITGNASTRTILFAAIGCILLSFFSPFMAIIRSIPKCVMGGACIALYGFIAVSGLQMIRQINLGENKNLFVVSSILVTGIGGMTLQFGYNSLTGGALLTVTSLATALIVGIITNLIVNSKNKDDSESLTEGVAKNAEFSFTENAENAEKTEQAE